MARHTGKDGVINIGGTEVGHITDWSIDEEAGSVPARAMGETWTQTLSTGGKSWSGSMEIELDEADAGQALLAVGSFVAASFRSEGSGAGKTEREGTVHIDRRSIRTPLDGKVTLSITFTGHGALTEAVLA